MILKKTKTVRINLGGYEHIEITVGYEGEELSTGEIDEMLNSWLGSDVSKASKLSNNEDSVSEVWEDQNG